MKKQLISFMAMVAVFVGITAFIPGKAQAAAGDFVIEKDGIYTRLVGYNGPGGDVVIPANVDVITSPAFSGCTTLSSVTIPGSVETVGADTFVGCTGLTGVTIQYGVENVSFEAFAGCTGLTNITIPGSVSLGQSVFLNCTGLTSVMLDDGITEIPDHVFDGCMGLTEIRIPGSVTFIDTYAFRDTPWLKSLGDFAVINGILAVYQGAESDITIPDYVKSISPGAFRDCPGLSKVTLPNSFTNIESRVFLNSHVKEVVIPESVTVIEDTSFSGCINLAGVVLPNSLTAIGNGAFCGCSSLTAVVIPSGVTAIGPFAFEQCTNLKKLVIPDSVTSIGNDLLWKSSNAVIYGKAGSYAERYSKENGIPFVTE